MKDYKFIPGYEGCYSISTCGYVYSHISRKILKFRFDSTGYKRVCLRGRDKSIHRLVAATYLVAYAENLEVNHIDGDKLNNTVSNLEMVTHKENMQHAFRNKLVNYRKGENSYLSKLSENDVLEIKRLLSSGAHPLEISKMFNCGYKNIIEIRAGRSWRHLS